MRRPAVRQKPNLHRGNETAPVREGKPNRVGSTGLLGDRLPAGGGGGGDRMAGRRAGQSAISGCVVVGGGRPRGLGARLRGGLPAGRLLGGNRPGGSFGKPRRLPDLHGGAVRGNPSHTETNRVLFRALRRHRRLLSAVVAGRYFRPGQLSQRRRLVLHRSRQRQTMVSPQARHHPVLRKIQAGLFRPGRGADSVQFKFHQTPGLHRRRVGDYRRVLHRTHRRGTGRGVRFRQGGGRLVDGHSRRRADTQMGTDRIPHPETGETGRADHKGRHPPRGGGVGLFRRMRLCSGSGRVERTTVARLRHFPAGLDGGQTAVQQVPHVRGRRAGRRPPVADTGRGHYRRRAV